MTDEMNGQATDEQPSAGPKPSPLNQPINLVLATVIRGILASCNNQNPAEVMSVLAYQTGLISAMILSGPLPELLRARKEMRDAYNAGLKAGGVNQTFADHPSKQPIPADLLKQKG